MWTSEAQSSGWREGPAPRADFCLGFGMRSPRTLSLLIALCSPEGGFCSRAHTGPWQGTLPGVKPAVAVEDRNLTDRISNTLASMPLLRGRGKVVSEISQNREGGPWASAGTVLSWAQ